MRLRPWDGNSAGAHQCVMRQLVHAILIVFDSAGRAPVRCRPGWFYLHERGILGRRRRNYGELEALLSSKDVRGLLGVPLWWRSILRR
jgi:hypothetical protein